MYAGLGVKEYFLFDPRGEHLTPRLQGYRLVDGVYERLSAVESIDRTLTMPSEVLGLELQAKVGGKMRFHDPATGEALLSHGEEHAARQEEAAARQEEAAARQEEAAAYRKVLARAEMLEVRVAELEARLREASR